MGSLGYLYLYQERFVWVFIPTLHITHGVLSIFVSDVYGPCFSPKQSSFFMMRFLDVESLVSPIGRTLIWPSEC